MTGIVRAFWNALKDTVSFYQQEDNNILFDENKFENFKELFEQMYQQIKNKYMDTKVDSLDRHKVAAVMIVSALDCEIISYAKNLGGNQLFFGGEMFATEVALNWMLESLNKQLSNLVDKRISSYFMPEAFACNTPYFDIFCRNLFFAKEKERLNPLAISETLFLIEYITLLKNDIDPTLLHE